MHPPNATHQGWRAAATALTALLLSALPLAQSRADDLLGVYVGGALGQAQVNQSGPPNVSASSFKENHSAIEVVLGMRPISLVAGELAYFDFGSPNGTVLGSPANASMKGIGAFGALYLPVPIVDIYAKLGVARVQSELGGNYPAGSTCNGQPCGGSLFQLDRTNTSLAGGVGAGFKFGAWSVRAEYLRFNAAGENPSLWTLGATWTFL